jgi:hypothetical protein
MIKYSNKTMETDPIFVAEIFTRYGEHLTSVITSIETQLSFYERSRAELKRLVTIKPEVYGKELEKIEFKIKEADLKLSYVVPRLAKICKELNEINQTDLIETNNEISRMVDSFLMKNQTDNGN